MGTITAKQLKQRTGELITRIKSGERLILTYRVKPLAVIAPSTVKEQRILQGLRPFDAAWRDIEDALERTEPPYQGWQEATRWVRDD